MALAITSSFIVLGLALALSAVVRKFLNPSQGLPLTAEWIDELSIERYRPMLRLLDSGDLEFLRSQPGFTRAMEARLRAQRCQIFRGYLKCLSADFGRVCAALKILMIQARRDRPDLATSLLRGQAMFAYGMLACEFKLVVYRLGLGTVDASDLVRIFDCMRLELRTVVPVTVAAGA